MSLNLKCDMLNLKELTACITNILRRATVRDRGILCILVAQKNHVLNSRWKIPFIPEYIDRHIKMETERYKQFLINRKADNIAYANRRNEERLKRRYEETKQRHLVMLKAHKERSQLYDNNRNKRNDAAFEWEKAERLFLAEVCRIFPSERLNITGFQLGLGDSPVLESELKDRYLRKVAEQSPHVMGFTKLVTLASVVAKTRAELDYWNDVVFKTMEQHRRKLEKKTRT